MQAMTRLAYPCKSKLLFKAALPSHFSRIRATRIPGILAPLKVFYGPKVFSLPQALLQGHGQDPGSGLGGSKIDF